MKNSILLILILVFGMLCSSCQMASGLSPAGSPLQITIEQVIPENNPGQYALYGETSLPDGTEFIVSAIRPLTSSTPEVSLSEEQIYGTLARKTAVAENGRWQAKLQLWQVSPDNIYQEIWQMQEPLASLPLAPKQEVIFAVTLSPSTLARNPQKFTPDSNSLGKNPLFNVTPNGEPYLEARETITIPLPNPNLLVTRTSQTGEKFSWAGRSTSSQVNTTFEDQGELPFNQNDNLPMTFSHSLQ